MKPKASLPIDLGTHLCQLYEGEDELKEVTLPFIRDGLLNGEYCQYVAADGVAVDEWYRELQAYGIDVRTARETGALNITTSDAWRARCTGGSLGMARDVLALVDQRLDIFPALRIAGDVSWGTEPAIASDLLCHWEATANVVFAGLPVRVICQYDIERYEPAFVHAALRTHPVVLYKGRRVKSPHYESPMILEQEPRLNGCSNDAKAVADMVAELAV